MVKNKYANVSIKRQSEMKELNEIDFFDIFLQENKNALLGDYFGEFEMIGTLINGKHIRNTHIRFTNVEDFENFNN